MGSSLAIIENNCVVAGRRLAAMDGALTGMVDSMRALQAAFTTPGAAPPQTFNMSTPLQMSQQPQPTANAPGLNLFAGGGQREPPAACGGRPLGTYPENLPQPLQQEIIATVIQPQGLLTRNDGSPSIAQANHESPAPQVPGFPESFTAPGGPGCAAASSPFDEDAVPRTPNVRPSGPYGPSARSDICSGWKL